MPREAEQRLVVLHERPPFHQQLLHPDEAGEGAADEEDLDLDRSRSGSRPPGRSPERRPTARASYPRRIRRKRNQTTERSRGSRTGTATRTGRSSSTRGTCPRSRHRGRSRRRCPSGGRRSAAGERSYLQRSRQRPRHEADRDPVHHDRGHDLVSARSSPSGLPGTAAKSMPPAIAASRTAGRCRNAGRKSRRERRGRVAVTIAEQVLTLDPDVEQTRLEAHRHRERREDQRRGGREHRRECRRVVGRRSSGWPRRPRADSRRSTIAINDPASKATPSAARSATPWTIAASTHGRAGGCRRDRRRAGGHQLASFGVGAPSMPRPISSGARVGRILAGDPPFVDRHDPIGERVDLVELGRDQEDAPCLPPSGRGSGARRTRSPRRRARGSAGTRSAASGWCPAHGRGSASAGSHPRACRR